MDLAAKRSALLRNKLVMRFACVLVAVGFLASSVVTPRAQAVAGVDDAAVVGSMALASYLSATGVELTVIEGGAASVTAGLGAVAGEYAAATGAAASGEAVLGGIAAGTMISAAGTIVLTAAAVAACAALGYWIYTTYFADVEADTPVSVYSDTGYFFADGTRFYLLGEGPNKTSTLIMVGKTYETSLGHTFCFSTDGCLLIDGEIYWSYGQSWRTDRLRFLRSDGDMVNWVFYDSLGYQVGGGFQIGLTLSDLGFVPVKKDLSVSVPADYELPEILPNQGMRINIGAAPGVTLPELAETVPQQVADGTLAPTYEIAVDPDAFGGNSTPDYEDLEDVDDLNLPSLGEALTKRFPFSIPWDIARGITLLAAPPKTPHFEVDFYAPISDLVGGWQGSTKIVLDFSQFESLGKLSRWTSTIGFCLFLASATKRFVWTA